MFKKRAKAKQSISSTSSQRSSLGSEEDIDAKYDSRQDQTPLARRDKLTIEDIRSRYGDPLEQRASSSDGAVGHDLGTLASKNQQTLAARGSQDSSTNELRKEIEDTAAGLPDDDWEAEQLRKVGMSMSRPVSQDNSLENIVERIRKRLDEINQRTQELEGLVNDLESSL